MRDIFLFMNLFLVIVSAIYVRDSVQIKWASKSEDNVVRYFRFSTSQLTID